MSHIEDVEEGLRPLVGFFRCLTISAGLSSKERDAGEVLENRPTAKIDLGTYGILSSLLLSTNRTDCLLRLVETVSRSSQTTAVTHGAKKNEP